MATPAIGPREVHLNALENYLISMARTVEISTGKVFRLLLEQQEVRVNGNASEIFMLEPRINEMEMLIDEHAVKLLRDNVLPEPEIGQIVATLKITNDLERMGDLAVGLAERLLSLAEMPERVRRRSWSRWLKRLPRWLPRAWAR
jgi:phosphate transport system protein